MTQPDPVEIRLAFRKTLRPLGAEAVELACSILDRVPPERWSVEWNLPWWLGEWAGLAPETSREFVLSNVLGLTSIRLADDLADGELGGITPDAARAMAGNLSEAAFAVYYRHLGEDASFWQVARGWLAEWEAATRRINDQAALPFVPTSTLVKDLVPLGAPLKISALAICSLTERRAVFPLLEECLDNLTAAYVLNDHADDWREDAEAGRWNAFAAACLAQEPSNGGAYNIPRVFHSVAMSDAPYRYYQLIEDCAQRARRIAVSLGLDPLAFHLSGFIDRAWETWAERRVQSQQLLDTMVAVLMAPSPHAPASTQQKGGE